MELSIRIARTRRMGVREKFSFFRFPPITKRRHMDRINEPRWHNAYESQSRFGPNPICQVALKTRYFSRFPLFANPRFEMTWHFRTWLAQANSLILRVRFGCGQKAPSLPAEISYSLAPEPTATRRTRSRNPSNVDRSSRLTTRTQVLARPCRRNRRNEPRGDGPWSRRCRPGTRTLASNTPRATKSRGRCRCVPRDRTTDADARTAADGFPRVTREPFVLTKVPSPPSSAGRDPASGGALAR